MDNAAGILLIVGSWLLPIAILVYVLQAINTIILGLRSINTATQRMAEALERIEARGDELP